MASWYEEMEKAEQEYDAREYELAQEYSRGYEQGRADKDKELSELPNQYSEKLWKIAYNKGKANAIDELDTSEHDKKVRADAIDECINEIKSHDFLYGIELIKILNQLKEQNNDT